MEHGDAGGSGGDRARGAPRGDARCGPGPLRLAAARTTRRAPRPKPIARARTPRVCRRGDTRCSEGERMKIIAMVETGGLALAALGALATAAAAQTAAVDPARPLLCAMLSVLECDASGQ